jgi:hypothetical protein
MTDIHIDNNFLNSSNIETILDYVTTTDDWVKTSDTWNGRFIHYGLISNNSVKDILDDLGNRVVELINSKDEVSVHIETFQLVRWRQGDKLEPPHADCENINGSLHPYPNRHYSVLVYLNDTYTGGQIYFPNQNLKPKTTPGTLVQFKGTKDYLHGVSEVTSGERYTIVMFLTKND